MSSAAVTSGVVISVVGIAGWNSLHGSGLCRYSIRHSNRGYTDILFFSGGVSGNHYCRCRCYLYRRRYCRMAGLNPQSYNSLVLIYYILMSVILKVYFYRAV